jgi:hypothetical protein
MADLRYGWKAPNWQAFRARGHAGLNRHELRRYRETTLDGLYRL